MHVIEGAHPATINSYLAYKDTEPPTDLVAADMNAVYRSLMRLCLDSGVGLAADGATDQTENWARVLKSVRRLARKAAWVEVPMNEGANKNLSGGEDEFNFRITGTEPDGNVFLPNETAYDGREIVVLNETTSDKFIQGFELSYLLRPGQAKAFIARAISGDDIEWRSTDGSMSGKFTVELRHNSGATVGDIGTCYWRVADGLVTITIEDMRVVLSGSETLGITAESDGGFPAAIDTPTNFNEFLARVETGGTPGLGYVLFYGAAGGSRKIDLRPPSGSTFATGSSGIISFSATYPYRNP
jgi:hypothetical protein